MFDMTAFRFLSFGPTHGRVITLRRLGSLLALWHGRHTQRADLAELDDHLLRDIGRTRAEARRECGKMFWR